MLLLSVPNYKGIVFFVV